MLLNCWKNMIMIEINNGRESSGFLNFEYENDDFDFCMNFFLISRYLFSIFVCGFRRVVKVSRVFFCLFFRIRYRGVLGMYISRNNVSIEDMALKSVSID